MLRIHKSVESLDSSCFSSLLLLRMIIVPVQNNGECRPFFIHSLITAAVKIALPAASLTSTRSLTELKLHTPASQKSTYMIRCAHEYTTSAALNFLYNDRL